MPRRAWGAALVMFICSVGLAGGEEWRKPLQTRLGFIGSSGALDEVYVVDTTSPERFDPSFDLVVPEGSRSDRYGFPVGVGSPLKLERYSQGKRTLVMEVVQPEPGILEYTYHADRSIRLVVSDGLVDGRMRRTIRAGRVVRADRSNLKILGVRGPDDTFEVLSDKAILRLSGRALELSRGRYSAAVLDPLWGKWSRARRMGAQIALLGLLILVLAVSRHVRRARSRKGEEVRGPAFLWLAGAAVLISGILVFLLDYRLI